MRDVVACPRCGSGNAPTMARCWVCGTPMTGPPPTAPPPATDDTLPFRAIGWLALLAGLVLVGGLVAIELALEWPGLLVPYALVQLVVFAALARTAWVNLRRPPAPAADGAAARAGVGASAPAAGGSAARAGVSGGEVVQGIALALTIALVVIALLALLAVSAIILFMMVCFGMIAVSGL